MNDNVILLCLFTCTETLQLLGLWNAIEGRYSAALGDLAWAGIVALAMTSYIVRDVFYPSQRRERSR